MNHGKRKDTEASSELIDTCEKDKVIEDTSKIKMQEVAAVIEPELESKDICMEINDVICRTGDQHTGLEEEAYQQIRSSLYKYEENLHFSSLKETRYKRHERVSRTNPVITLNRIKLGRVVKRERLETMSLRQRVLMRMTLLKYFSDEDGGFTSCDDLPSEFKAFEVKRSKIPDEENDETRNSSLESIDENPFFPNEFYLRPASTNLSQESSRDEIQHSVSAQSIYSPWDFVSPKISYVTAVESRTQEIRCGEDVWHHFKGFLHANKESLDRILSDDTSSENIETSHCTNRSVKDAKMTVQEIVNQSLEKPFNTELEDIKTEIQHDLGSGIKLILRTEPKSAVVLIREIRSGLLEIIRWQEKKAKGQTSSGPTRTGYAEANEMYCRYTEQADVASTLFRYSV